MEVASLYTLASTAVVRQFRHTWSVPATILPRIVQCDLIDIIKQNNDGCGSVYMQDFATFTMAFDCAAQLFVEAHNLSTDEFPESIEQFVVLMAPDICDVCAGTFQPKLALRMGFEDVGALIRHGWCAKCLYRPLLYFDFWENYNHLV